MVVLRMRQCRTLIFLLIHLQGIDMAVDKDYGNLLVGKGVTINGVFQVPGEAFIDGKAEGELTADAINVTANGVVTGNAVASHVKVAGLMEKSITAKTSLLVESTGSVRGSITYSDLEIRKGGEVEGNIVILGSGGK
jgi:cytoskeletal protein CcmA (bactofilin family)